MICSVSTKLDQKAIEAINYSLEEKLGKIFLAFSCHDPKPEKIT
jgi:hypothetical protein